MALIRLCNFGKSYWLMLCTLWQGWHWSIYSLILTLWAVIWLTDKPLNLSGNEAGVLQHSAPSLAFFHSKDYLCCVNLLRTSLTASYEGSKPGHHHRSPPCEPFLDGVDCVAILCLPTGVKYPYAYSHCCDLYPTAILPNHHTQLTPYTHDWTPAHCPYRCVGCEDLPRCSLAEYKYSYYYYVKNTDCHHCHCFNLCYYHVDCAPMLCQMWCEITAAVPHSLYPVKKLTPDRSQRDCGCEIHPGIDGGICATIIDLPILMDPVTLLLIFNITIWCYWTFK